ncbi:hypothetical protein DIPPA_00171 [Diplonema papillatum]|nr:hypothetical protein DIPPA_00171 [Diplonema papillatum]
MGNPSRSQMATASSAGDSHSLGSASCDGSLLTRRRISVKPADAWVESARAVHAAWKWPASRGTGTLRGHAAAAF